MTREDELDMACTNWICNQKNGTVIKAREVWKAAVKWADQHPQMKPENKLQDFKKKVEKLKEIDSAEEYAKQLAHLFLGNGLSLQTILLMAIDFGQQHPHWISVEDELPKEQGKYMFLLRNGDMYYETYYPKLKLLDNVTHWMPIVPPRKEDKK